MISSLLKNRELRLQLLVGLLLVLGTFPGPSEGLTCHACVISESDCSKTQECLPSEGYCYNHKITLNYPDGKGTGYGGEKSCISNEEAECLKKMLGSSCKTATNADGRGPDELALARINCTKPKQRKGEGSFSESLCVCDSDLCNTDNGCTCAQTGGGGHSSILHPFNGIIITILTFAFYKYI